MRIIAQQLAPDEMQALAAFYGTGACTQPGIEGRIAISAP